MKNVMLIFTPNAMLTTARALMVGSTKETWETKEVIQTTFHWVKSQLRRPGRARNLTMLQNLSFLFKVTTSPKVCPELVWGLLPGILGFSLSVGKTWWVGDGFGRFLAFHVRT